MAAQIRRRIRRESTNLAGNVQDTPNISGPITMTITITWPIPTSTTQLILTPTSSDGLERIPDASSTTSAVAANPESIFPPTTTSTTQSLSTASQGPLSQGSPQYSTLSQPAPSAAVNSNGNFSDTTAQSSGVVKSRGLPTVTIVGITIASSLVFLAAVILLVRKRFVQMRQRRRARWTNNARTTVSSFEPREKFTNSTFPPQSTVPVRGELSPGFSFARAQQQALAKFPPVPPLPPQIAYGSYVPTPGPPTAPTPGPVPSPALPTSSNTRFVSSAPYNATVKCTFVPTLPDELSIRAGEVMRVLSEYDDGWGLCSSARGEQGMVPLECLSRGVAPKLGQKVQNLSPLRRTTSLAAARRGGRL